MPWSFTNRPKGHAGNLSAMSTLARSRQSRSLSRKSRCLGDAYYASLVLGITSFVKEPCITSSTSEHLYYQCCMSTHHDKHTCSHGVKRYEVKEGVHYVPLGIENFCSRVVEMVQEAGQVKFREPPYLRGSRYML